MTGRSEPPDGPPENSAGGEDEYRSLVFDESFVRAARMQEFSAEERMGLSTPGPSAPCPRNRSSSGAAAAAPGPP